jgi:hypothetical protein
MSGTAGAAIVVDTAADAQPPDVETLVSHLGQVIFAMANSSLGGREARRFSHSANSPSLLALASRELVPAATVQQGLALRGCFDVGLGGPRDA